MKLNRAIMSQIADTTHDGPIHDLEPIREPRINGINPVPWLLGTLAIILLALAVFGVI